MPGRMQSASRIQDTSILPVVALDPLAQIAPDRAVAISTLLRASIQPGTFNTYSSGFRSLASHCLDHGLCPMPVSTMTLISWMEAVTSRPRDPLTPSTVKKYRSAIRWHHVMNGAPWPHDSSMLLQTAFRSIRRLHPEPDKKLKIPISLSLFIDMASALVPNIWAHGLAMLSFNDIAWLTASSIMFFGTLRGGEALTYPGSGRPVLEGHMLSFISLPGVGLVGVQIRVPAPKTAQNKQFQHSYALDSEPSFLLNPSRLLTLYRERARTLGVNVLERQPAFKARDGSVLSKFFMF